MGAPAPNLPVLPSPDERENLFAMSVLPEGRGRGGRALPLSIAAHVLIGLSLVLVPLLSTDNPDLVNAYTISVFNPPPAAAPPLALGSEVAKPVEKAKPEAVVKEPTPEPKFVAPQEAELTPETTMASIETQGSTEGVLGGDTQGLIGGIEGGIVGGVPNGVVGGVIGGTGPVTDFDQGPRPLRRANPSYPHEAFIKKIEGTVTVEILIDASGRVVQARVLNSIPALDRAAVDCAYQWVFVPAMRRGQAVPVVAHLPIRFTIY
jgi:TonB family protein